jgi:hypothetical protein
MSSQPRLARRLRPVFAAAFLHSVALWVPTTKLFMTGGFDNGSVAVMTATSILCHVGRRRKPMIAVQ